MARSYRAGALAGTGLIRSSCSSRRITVADYQAPRPSSAIVGVTMTKTFTVSDEPLPECVARCGVGASHVAVRR